MSTTAPFSDLTTKCESAYAAILAGMAASTADHLNGLVVRPGICAETFDNPAVICFSDGMSEEWYGTQFHRVSTNCQIVSPRTADTNEAARHKLRVAVLEDTLLSYNGLPNQVQGHYSALAAALTTAVSNLHALAVIPGEVTQLIDEEQWTYNRQMFTICEWTNATT